jgi:DNA polymerase I
MLRRCAECIGLGDTDSLVVVFDTNTGNSNKDLSPAYKANRPKFEPDEESPFKHLPQIQTALEALGIAYLEIPNIEADDIVATLARSYSAAHQENEVFIASADSDFYQLLDEQVSILKLKPLDQYEVMTPKHVSVKLGVEPHEYVFFKSLIGDTADNIAGIKGVGPVTAKKIVKGLIPFDHDAHADMLELNQKLITLNTKAEFPHDPETFTFRDSILRYGNQEIFDMCDF